MRAKVGRLGSGVLLALVLAACGGSGYTTQQQTVGGYTFTLERPPQATLLKNYDLFVTIADPQGKAVNDARVFLDMTMPAMPMGASQPLADPPTGGRYRVNTVFTMTGDWRVTVHAKIGGKEYAATFDQPVQP